MVLYLLVYPWPKTAKYPTYGGSLDRKGMAIARWAMAETSHQDQYPAVRAATSAGVRARFHTLTSSMDPAKLPWLPHCKPPS